MRFRRVLFLVLPLALVLGACSDPTGPRLPDEGEGGKDDPDSRAMIWELPAE